MKEFKHVLPVTTPGKWAVGLVISFFVFLIIGILVVVLGHQTGGDTFFDNLYISIPMILSGISGIAAFFAGIAGILIRKERSIIVFLCTGIGLLVIIFVLGEFLGSH
jgi:hypothetical protein